MSKGLTDDYCGEHRAPILQGYDGCYLCEIDRLTRENAELSRRLAIAEHALTDIAQPALGGKMQQYAAQAALAEMNKDDEKGS